MTSGTFAGDLRRLAGYSALYTVVAVLARGSGFLLLPLYTRYLDPAQYGIVAAAGLVSAVLGVVLPLSLHASLARLYHDARDEEGRRRAVGSIWLAIGTVALFATILLDATGGRPLQLLVQSVPFDPYLRLALWTALLNAIGLVPLQYLQTVQRARAYALLSSAGVLVGAAAVVVFVVLLRGGAEGYLTGVLIGSAVTAMLGMLMVLPTVRLKLQPRVVGAGLVFSLPLLPHVLAGWVLELSDRAILERFVPLSDLGVYAVGYQIALLMGVIAASLNGAIAPYIYASDARLDASEAGSRAARLATYFALVIACVGCALVLFAGDLVRLLASAPFQGAERVARPVIVGQLAAGLYLFPVNLLFVRARTGLVAGVSGIAAVTNVLLNLWFIPRYGIVAAAWTTCAAYILMLVLACVAAERTMPLRYEWGRLVRLGVVTACVLAFGFAAADIAGLLGVLLRAVVLLLLPALLWAAGFIFEHEIAMARRFVARRFSERPAELPLSPPQP